MGQSSNAYDVDPGNEQKRQIGACKPHYETLIVMSMKIISKINSQYQSSNYMPVSPIMIQNKTYKIKHNKIGHLVSV